MAIKLQEFIEKITPIIENVNSITDPSRSEFDRRMKHNHNIVVTGYRDKWIDINNPHYDKALRLADNQPGDDTADYKMFNESFQAGRIELADESVFRITEEQAAALNDYISEMHLTQEKLEQVVESIKANSDILFETVELAMAAKEL